MKSHFVEMPLKMPIYFILILFNKPLLFFLSFFYLFFKIVARERIYSNH